MESTDAEAGISLALNDKRHLILVTGGDILAYAGFKYRLYPNKEQQNIIKKTIGCARFVYNHFLEEALAVYEKRRYFPLRKFNLEALPKLEEENPFLKEVDEAALVNAIFRLDAAEKRFKEVPDTGLPKKKHRSNGGAYKVMQPISVKADSITMPGLGEVKCKISRWPQGTIKSGTVSMTPSGEFYVSLTCSFWPKAKQKTGAAVGVDLGIDEFAITSDGDNFPNEHLYSRELKKLRRLNRAFSRKLEAAKDADARPGEYKGSNLTENRLKIAKLHQQIVNQMHDSINKATTQLVEQYDIICIENIDVSKIRENRDYSKQMVDVLFFEFRRQLDYKCKWYGKALVIVSGPDGAAVLPHPATVDGARGLLDAGLKQLNK